MPVGSPARVLPWTLARIRSKRSMSGLRARRRFRWLCRCLPLLLARSARIVWTARVWYRLTAIPRRSSPNHVQMSKLPTARMRMAPASLIVAPDSLAVASGGVEADFKKIRFHYSMVGGYRVVTWSVHGLTYALVSQEDNGTQRSCMVCHSAMRDRDLSHTPTPLNAGSSTVQFFLQ